MRASIRFALAMLLVGAAGSAAQSQDSLDPVRDLYASAEYEEALSALGRLKTNADTGGLPEIDRYRVLCLIALGRSAEADQVIETIVTTDPLYQPAAADAAPRVRAAFTAVRRRVLPGVVRNLYANAKAAFDRKEFPEAADGLDRTVRVIDNLDSADNRDLADLRLLASGFLELSRASMAPPPLPVAAPPANVAASPDTVHVPAASPAAPTVVAIRQDVPKPPFFLGMVSGEFRGAIEVEIDEGGNVISAKMVQPIHSLYDPLLLKAARDWKYEPARIGARLTKMHKRIDIVLRP